MDFHDLQEKNLNQKLRRIRNWRERWRIEKAVVWLLYGGSTKLLDKIEGIEFVEFVPERLDCAQYSLGHTNVRELVPGIIEHNGTAQAGDIILYLRRLKSPTHMGVMQEDGRVLSKWGDYGPVMLHRIDQIPLFDYGNYRLFSTHPRIFMENI